MIESPFSLDHHEEGEPMNLKGIVLKYFRYWPYFLAALLFGLFCGFLYMRYAPIIYWSTAKVKVIDDDKELDISSEAISAFNGNSNINLNNEIQVLKSYRILEQVVEALNLDVAFYDKGQIKTTEIWKPPFVITKNFPRDSVQKTMYYSLRLNPEGITIKDSNDAEVVLDLQRPEAKKAGLPFAISVLENADLAAVANFEYIVAFRPIKEAVMELTYNLIIQPTDKKSDIISLELWGENYEKNEAVINAIIDKFNQDGVLDRQLVSKRTLDFIDERFVYLSRELDSIESGKQDYKQENNLSYIQEDASYTLQKKSTNEADVLRLRTQVSLSNLLKESVRAEAAYNLLPSAVGLENNSVNLLVSNYNDLVLDREKLITSVGEGHPTLVALNGQLERGKENILNTVEIYLRQLQTALAQQSQEQSLAGSQFSRLPEKEKILRSIERQQSIKENLFLLLLQKREEAAINYAVTAPSIKVVDYALTSNQPLSPKKKIVYPVAVLLGMLVPFLVLFIRFSLDSKIHSRTDIEKIHPAVPILAEIPFIKGHKSIKLKDDRSVLAESFRMMSTYLGYMLPINNLNLGKVVYVTSSIDGEGKSMLAHNLSLSFASLHKKVLLLEADLRKPQLNTYYNVGNNIKGLSDYLFNPEMNWQECLYKGDDDSKFHKVCFSGTIPINAPQLLAGEGFERFLNLAKEAFDYIIVDTAPTMLVADTLLISKYADVTVFVTRAGYTDKKLLAFSKSLSETNKLKNMAYVINDVAPSKNKQYTYGYDYANQKA